MNNIDKPNVLSFKREGGGLAIVPWSEVGIISTLFTNKGTAEAPELVVDETKSLVHVKAIDTNIIVLHSAEEISCWLSGVEWHGGES